MIHYILDTNTVLCNPYVFNLFDNCNFIITSELISELDRSKKGFDTSNMNARVFSRLLYDILESNQENKPYIIDKERNVFLLFLDPIFYQDKSLPNDDNLINAAQYLRDKGINASVLSGDNNLCIKAKFRNINVTRFNADRPVESNELSKGYSTIDDVSASVFEELFSNPAGIANINGIDPMPNEFFILKNGKQSALAKYNLLPNSYERVTTGQASNIKPKNVEQIFALDALMNPNIPVVALTGKAGSGKTLLSIAAAIAQKSKYTQIMISKPIVPMGNDIGYLPGDIKEKLMPYMQSMMDNIKFVKMQSGKPELIDQLIQSGKIIVEPLTYIRGRSLPKVFFIIDEAQNLTRHEMKTIVTRIGEGSKLVLIGDMSQIDIPNMDSRSNGLAHLIRNFTGSTLFAHVHLEKSERSQVAELASNVL